MALEKVNQHITLFFCLVKYMYSGLNRKKLVGTVCLDVAKAFDCLRDINKLISIKWRQEGAHPLQV